MAETISKRIVYGLTRNEWFERVLGERDEILLEKAIEMALSGHDKMLQFLLGRTLPPRIADNLLNMKRKLQGTLDQKADQVMQAMSDKEITPSEVEKVMGALQKQAMIHEATDVEKRIQALEETYKIGMKSSRKF